MSTVLTWPPPAEKCPRIWLSLLTFSRIVNPPKAVVSSLQGKEAMRTALHQFWSDENGQDLIECALLLALVVLGSAALMSSTGTPVTKVWTSTNYALLGQAAPSNTPAPTPPAQTPPDDDDHGHH